MYTYKVYIIGNLKYKNSHYSGASLHNNWIKKVYRTINNIIIYTFSQTILLS